MKKTRIITLAALTIICILLTSFAGCAVETSSSANETVPPETTEAALNIEVGGLLEDGILQVGQEVGYPPFEYYATDGETIVGFDADLINAIGDVLDIEIKTIDTGWDGIFSGLDSNRYDVVCSAVTINAERKETMDFTQPYIENWQAIVVKKSSAPITSVEGLDGLKVGYQGSTTSDEYLADLMNTNVLDCETSSYDKILQAFDDLKLGRIDAILCDSTVADGYLSREPEEYNISWNQSSEEGAEAETFGIAVKKGNTQLQEALDAAIDVLKENGKLDEIKNEWF
ncbi:MAG: transporter substrate-binding domain-containing protein [Oscillospiraceae bacterium]|jgi:polar amino acid transport system substrate-binding protein|nr:transporter substrate-binding domain-containing protein [Oscillospiraceae bacterium]